MPSTKDLAHARKKQMQTSISRYLRPIEPSTAREDNGPQLPKETQAMLISVGMRVRKSVPEGYKTSSLDMQASFSQESLANQPECDLHKIGRLLSPKSSPMSSQKTTSSQDSSVTVESDGRKRTYEEEAEEAMDMIFDDAEQCKARPIAKARPTHRHAHDWDEAPFLCPRDEMDMG